MHVRLDHVSAFPFVQPEHSRSEWDLAVPDQRLAANVLCSIAGKESHKNLREPSLQLSDGTPDEEVLNKGMPLTWQTLAKIPSSGVFRVSYVCAPEARNVALRRKLLESHSFWAAALAHEEQVL